jgi:hypothetical protein
MYASCIVLLWPRIHSSRPVCRFSCAILEHARTLAHGLKCAHRQALRTMLHFVRHRVCPERAKAPACIHTQLRSCNISHLLGTFPLFSACHLWPQTHNFRGVVISSRSCLAFVVISVPSHRHCTVITNFACERRTRSALTATAAAMESTRTWPLHRLRHSDVILKSALFRAHV